MLFVVLDTYSKWPEIYPMSTTTASKTIIVLREMFAHYGLPKVLVSNNGTQFIAEEFRHFMEDNGIRHVRTSPYHPVSNGAAERLVQTVKRALCTADISLKKALAKFLLTYQNSPHTTTGVAPSSLFLGQTLRTRLDLLRPNVGD